MSEISKSISEKRERFILFIVLTIYPLLGMGIDLIAPSLPAITEDLQISSTISKNLISIYLLGYVLGNFFTGFLSDALGRRRFILSGFMLFIVSSLLPYFLQTSLGLLMVRFFQGLSIGVVAIGASAVISDVVRDQKKLLRISALRAMFWGIGPILGPVIGGYLQNYFNWQSCFYFFALYGLFCLIAILCVIPETHLNRQPINFNIIKNNFKIVINHHIFMGLVFLMGTQYALLIVFNTLGPFLIQDHLGYSPIYFGHMAFFLGIIFLLGTLSCRYLTKKFQAEQIIKYAVLISLLAATIGFTASFFVKINLLFIMTNSFVTFFCCGIIYPACMGKALALFRHVAGSSAAVMNLVNILVTSLAAFLASLINTNHLACLSISYFILLVLCGLCFKMKVNTQTVQNLN